MITNQTVTDRIAEKLQSTEFGQWFGEDDLLALTREAITKAFFTGKPGEYNRDPTPPAIVQFAQKHVTEYVDKIVREQVAAYIKENPEFVAAAIEKAISVGIDQIILRTVVNVITGSAHDFSYQIQNNIRQALGRM